MTDSPVPLATHHPDLSIDQRLALRTAATRLHSEFGQHFGVETIQRFLHSSYDQFAGRATIPNFLPLLAERWARQRLTALARVEGKITDTKPTVLFLCTSSRQPTSSAIAATAAGIDITREFPVFPGKRYEEWVLPDPAGQSVDAVRPIRDDIEERVRRLLTELDITPTD